MVLFIVTAIVLVISDKGFFVKATIDKNVEKQDVHEN